MQATWPHYSVRKTHLLNGLWDFTFMGADCDLDSLDPTTIDFAQRVAVPSVFDTIPGYEGMRGTAAYRTRITATPDRAGRLHFQGLGLWARVYVDGETLGQCALPYSSFWVDVPPSKNVHREVVVVVDNRFDPDRMSQFKPRYDFYAYGGIYRSVTWHEVPPLSIDRVQILTTSVEDGAITAKVILHGAIPPSVDLAVRIDDGPEQRFDNVPVAKDTATLDLIVENPLPWAPATPNLHTLSVTTGQDDIIERFGIRTVQTIGADLCVNGTPVKLLGFCRHEAHPQFGPALPHQQLVHDIEILEDLGCNFVRGSHYPQDPRFLDLCDERGIMVWEETLGWGNVQNECFNNPTFCDLQESQARTMVQSSINHPSILLWGFLNEGQSNGTESCSLYSRLAAAIRQEDSSRLVTYATMFPYDDKNYDICDVIGINKYPAWYPEDYDNARPLHEIVTTIRKIADHLDSSGHSDKPIIISEMGAGAIYGWRDNQRTHWSEEYQSDYLGIACTEVVTNKRIAGISLWQLFDCRTYATAHALKRPRGFNNKGVLDEYRRPKMAYQTVKDAFRSANP